MPLDSKGPHGCGNAQVSAFGVRITALGHRWVVGPNGRFCAAGARAMMGLGRGRHMALARPGRGLWVSVVDSASRTTEHARGREPSGPTGSAGSGCGIALRRRPGMKLYAGAGHGPGT